MKEEHYSSVDKDQESVNPVEETGTAEELPRPEEVSEPTQTETSADSVETEDEEVKSLESQELDSQGEEETAPEKKKKPTKRITAVIVGLLVLLLTGLLVWSIFFSNADNKRFEDSVVAELGQLENKTYEEIQAELNRVIEKGNMSISINANPVFPDGDSKGNLQIENSPANHYAQEVVITLKDTGEEIYRSGLLKPNYHIQNDKLDKDLKAGEYECVASFVAYETSAEDPDDYIQVGTAAAEIVISVVE